MIPASALQKNPFYPSSYHKAKGCTLGLGLYTLPYYTGLVYEGLPEVDSLLPGTAAFPESRETGVALGQGDPVRSHTGMTLAATIIAGRLLSCLPAMLALLQALPRAVGPFAAGGLHLFFSPSTLLLAAVLLSAFGQLGLPLGYTLTPWGGLVLHVTPEQLRALEAHYGALSQGG